MSFSETLATFNQEFPNVVIGTIFRTQEYLGLLDHEQHARNTAITMAPEPTTVIQYYNKFITFVGEYHELLGFSNLHRNFYILLYSTFFDSEFKTTGKAYNNIFADLTLKSGNPDDINQYIDTFTWEGWAWGFAFWVVWHTFVYLSSGVLASFAFMIWYMFNTDIPLCTPDDMADNWFTTTLGVNLCSEAWM